MYNKTKIKFFQINKELYNSKKANNRINEFFSITQPSNYENSKNMKLHDSRIFSYVSDNLVCDKIVEKQNSDILKQNLIIKKKKFSISTFIDFILLPISQATIFAIFIVHLAVCNFLSFAVIYLYKQ